MVEEEMLEGKRSESMKFILDISLYLLGFHPVLHAPFRTTKMTSAKILTE